METKIPSLNPDQVLVQTHQCALCRTDLHIIEGDIPAHKIPIILGHQVVGEVIRVGGEPTAFWLGKRVGLPWLFSVDNRCPFCRTGLENLCDNALFTGYDVDGGFATFVVTQKDFFYELPSAISDVCAAPLLCGGVIGFRAFRFAQLEAGNSLCLYGFGSSAHLLLQLGKCLGIQVFVRSRSEERLTLAQKLGADWTGEYDSPIPHRVEAGIIFAPSGGLIPLALKDIRKGGRLILAGIHMNEIPSFSYSLIYEERSVLSVTNSTRRDVTEFLALADQYKIAPEVKSYSFSKLIEALTDLKEGRLQGTAVLRVQEIR